MAKVIVAGAGINGVSSAIWLQRAGHDVVLIDRAGPASGTSYGNAGVLAAGSIIPITTPGLLAKIPKCYLILTHHFLSVGGICLKLYLF